MALIDDLLQDFDPALTGDSTPTQQRARYERFVTEAGSKTEAIPDEAIKAEAALEWCRYRIFGRAVNYLIAIPEKTDVNKAGSTDLGDIGKRIYALERQRDNALGAFNILTKDPVTEPDKGSERTASGFLPVEFSF